MAPRLAIRLDNGQIITQQGKLTAAEAFAAGRLNEADLLRASALLCAVHAKLPEHLEPLKSVSVGSKRSSLDTTTLEIGVPAVKRAHSDAAPAPAEPAAAAAPHAGAPPPAPGAPPPGGAPAPGDWESKCSLLTHWLADSVLGKVNKDIFYHPVPATAPYAASYAAVVKQPVWLALVLDRLASRAYDSPAAYWRDMQLLFDNAVLFNGPHAFVGQLALSLEAAFDREWARTPFAAATPAKRARVVPPQAAGGAAGGGAPRRAASGGARGRAGAPAPGRPGAAGGRGRGRAAGAPGGGGAAAGRTKSVNSYHMQPLPADRQAALAAALQDEAVLEAKMDGVVRILQTAGELPTNAETGEVELDLSALTAGTTWKLYDYVLGGGGAGGGGGAAAGGAAPAKGGLAPAPSGPRLAEQEDSDYAPDAEEDL